MHHDPQRESLSHLDLTAERLESILQETQQSLAMEIDAKDMEEIKRLLGQSELCVERFHRVESMQVKDYHVWSIKKPEIKDQVLHMLFERRNALREATAELERVFGQLKSLRSRLTNAMMAYQDLARDLDQMAHEAQGMGNQPEMDNVRREVLPALERLMQQLERAMLEVQKEINARLRMIDYVGRQISGLRDEPLFYPLQQQRATGIDDDLPPDQDEGLQEGPTQAEALVEHQDELLKESTGHEQDRGRRDERKGSRGGKR